MVRRERSIHRRASAFRAAALVSFIALSAVAFSAAATIVFGPRTYQRGTGKPVAVTSTFQVAHLLNPYTLRVVNNGVTTL
jgi:hypothetical protein